MRFLLDLHNITSCGKIRLSALDGFRVESKLSANKRTCYKRAELLGSDKIILYIYGELEEKSDVSVPTEFYPMNSQC